MVILAKCADRTFVHWNNGFQCFARLLIVILIIVHNVQDRTFVYAVRFNLRQSWHMTFVPSDLQCKEQLTSAQKIIPSKTFVHTEDKLRRR